MRAIQRHLPSPRHVELHRIRVEAPPAVAWEAARHFDAGAIPWVRLLFDLRALPARLTGRAGAESDRRVGIDQVAEHGKGFVILEEEPGRHVVVGAIGRFWQGSIPFADVVPGKFARFDTPGWGKLAWAIEVEPYGGGSTISLELRTTATDDYSWRRLEWYFRLIGPASALIRRSVMAHLESQLGAMTPMPDAKRSLPGDDLLPGARYSLTHAADIEAPPALVWPWLMQLGCDRGGWYSIDALDHAGVPSVDHLVPEWTDRRLGDKVATTLEQDGFYAVRAIEPGHLLALAGETDRLGGHVQMIWSFVLEPIGEDATRLVTRVRAAGTPRWSEWIQGAAIFPPIHAFMQHAQLENLKRLVEGQAHARRV